ncbi:MAG: thiamine phosphate synthase, partial [Spirochaetes bacterium]|nr:thiamine phosphate synthase [Spirochaetota bacterium]
NNNETEQSMVDLFTRNVHRAIEAVRSLEEFARNDSKDASGFHTLRFALYAFEKEAIDLLVRKNYRKYFTNSLYAILDPLFAGNDLISAAHSLIAGGSKIVQLRMKNAPTKEIISIARQIRPICERHNVIFIINDRPDIASCVDADGVHLGQEDMEVSDARKVLGIGKIVGVSTHSLEQAKSAANAHADYIAIGPVFDTSSKYGTAMKGIGIEVVKQVLAISKVPVVAIGGINAMNIKMIKEIGINSVAIMSALYAGDLVRNCQQLATILSE